MTLVSLISACTSMKPVNQNAAHEMTQGNPYLPLWEHIPDGEPYVFDDPDQPGKQRVYIFGSHDIERTTYCGREQVVWSASTDSLNRWRYDGISFKLQFDRNGKYLNYDSVPDMLYAPDVAEVLDANGKKTYYLYPNDQNWGRNALIAKADRPDGPYEVCNWNPDTIWATRGLLGFDPAVFVDDDGRVYGYWGIETSYGAELDPTTMCTLKPGTQVVKQMVGAGKDDELFRFFEASSIRKVKDKYIFIYSRWSGNGEFGLPTSNYTLAYAYSDQPLGPWTYGGTIIDGRGREVNEQGDTIASGYPTGNTHGSICEINGQWYVFYHRSSGVTDYARQSMVAAITVDVEEGPGGRVIIPEAEYTSEGFAIEGLNPYVRHTAGIACWHTGPKFWSKDEDEKFTGSYIEASYGTDDRFDDPYNLKDNMNRVVNNTDGSIVGYKYFNFDKTVGRKNMTLHLQLQPEGIDGAITIMVDRPWTSQGGKVLGTIELKADMPQQSTELTAELPALTELSGKHALYFTFSSPTKGKSICSLESLVFDNK